MTFSPCFPTHGTHLALLLIFLIFIPVCSLCRYLGCRLCLNSQISNLPSFFPGQTQGAFSLWIRPSDALRPVWLRFKFFICCMNPSFVLCFFFFVSFFFLESSHLQNRGVEYLLLKGVMDAKLCECGLSRFARGQELNMGLSP